MVIYEMHRPGTTYGAETDRKHRYKPGSEIKAPEGEFRHLPEGSYSVRPVVDAQTRKDAPDEEATEAEEPEAPDLENNVADGVEIEQDADEPLAETQAIDVQDLSTGDGPWYELPWGEKVRGKDKAADALREKGYAVK